jgi:hypothetical protein
MISMSHFHAHVYVQVTNESCTALDVGVEVDVDHAHPAQNIVRPLVKATASRPPTVRDNTD